MKTMILLVNDDGIMAPGLQRLAEEARRFGEVWIVAPDGQRSAASHSITLHAPIDVTPVEYPVEGVRAYQCSGTPADCVRVGCLHVLPRKPDYVLSGINKGYNAGTDLQYSATVGAAFEAVFQGVPGIALSEGFGDCHEVSDAYLGRILERLLRDTDPSEKMIWNVNFPDCRLSECRGIAENRTVSHGMFYKDTYDVIEELPDDGVRLMVHGTYTEESEPGSDLRAVVERYVSLGQVATIHGVNAD